MYLRSPAFNKRLLQTIVKTVVLCLLVQTFVALHSCKSDSDTVDTAVQRKAAHPKAVQYLFNAEYAYKNGVYRSALMMSDSALHYAPELADIHFLRGMIYTELLQFDEAKAAYDKVLSLDPDYPGIYLNLGNTAFRQGDLKQALRLYKKEKNSVTQVNVMIQVGRAYSALGQIDSAKIAYQKAIELDSSLATVYMRLSELYREEGELERAVYFGKKGLSIEPQNLNYQYIVASTLLLSGQAEEAGGLLKNITEKQPWHYWANYNYAQALLRSGQELEAKRYFAHAESLQTELELIDEWRAMVEANPDQQGIWVHYGDVLAKSGRMEEAIHAHNVALSLGPPYAALQINLATLYMIHGDTSKAMGWYDRILKADSTNTDAWLNLGVAYAQAGKTEQARQAWEKVLQYAPQDSLTLVYLRRLSAGK